MRPSRDIRISCKTIATLIAIVTLALVLPACGAEGSATSGSVSSQHSESNSSSVHTNSSSTADTDASSSSARVEKVDASSVPSNDVGTNSTVSHATEEAFSTRSEKKPVESSQLIRMSNYDFSIPRAWEDVEYEISSTREAESLWSPGKGTYVYDSACVFSVDDFPMCTLQGHVADSAMSDHVEMEEVSPRKLNNGYTMRIFEGMDKLLYAQVSNDNGVTCEISLQLVEGFAENQPFASEMLAAEAAAAGVDPSIGNREVAYACLESICEGITIRDK